MEADHPENGVPIPRLSTVCSDVDLQSHLVTALPRHRARPEMLPDGSHYSNVNETIDVTAFDRWRADPGYRPET